MCERCGRSEALHLRSALVEWRGTHWQAKLLEDGRVQGYKRAKYLNDISMVLLRWCEKNKDFDSIPSWYIP